MSGLEFLLVASIGQAADSGGKLGYALLGVAAGLIAALLGGYVAVRKLRPEMAKIDADAGLADATAAETIAKASQLLVEPLTQRISELEQHGRSQDDRLERQAEQIRAQDREIGFARQESQKCHARVDVLEQHVVELRALLIHHDIEDIPPHPDDIDPSQAGGPES